MDEEKPSARKSPRGWTAISVVMLLVGLLCAALGTTTYYQLTNGVQIICFGIGALVTALFILLLFVLGRVGVHAYRVRHLLNLGIVPGVFGLGLGIPGFANGALDPNPLEEHEVRVLRVQHGYNTGPEYVEDWREGHEGGEIAVRTLPEGAGPGSRVVLVIGPGLFGPWLADVRHPESPSSESPSR